MKTFDVDEFIAEPETSPIPVAEPIAEAGKITAEAEFDPDKFVEDEPLTAPIEIDAPTEQSPFLTGKDWKNEEVSLPGDTELTAPTLIGSIRSFGVGVADRAKRLFTERLPETFDVNEISPEAAANPLAAPGLGVLKAYASLAAGFSHIPKLVAETINEKAGVEFMDSPDSLELFSESMQHFANTLDIKRQEEVMKNLQDGKTVTAVTQTVAGAVGDAIGMLSAMKTFGIKPGSAGTGTRIAQATSRLQHAASFGVIRALGTRGSIEDRMNAGILATMYMSSTSISGAFGKATVPVDAFINTMVSLLRKEKGFGLGGQYSDARNRAAVDAAEFGVDEKTLRYMYYAKVAGFDLGYSLMTRPFASAEAGRAIPIDRTAALEQVGKMEAGATRRVGEATTPQEREMALDDVQAAQRERATIESLQTERVVYDNPTQNFIEASRQVQHNADRNAEFESAMFHGGPHVWEPEPGFAHGRPRLDKVGSGEGAAAFGWGWYSAESEGVARSYQTAGSGKFTLDGKERSYYTNNPEYIKPVNADEAAGILIAEAGSKKSALTGIDPRMALFDDKSLTETAVRAAVESFDESRIAIPDTSSLYKLDLPDDVLPKLLDWDKPVAGDLTGIAERAGDIEGYDNFEHLAIAALRNEHPRGKGYVPTGEEVYNDLSDLLGGQQAASEFLARAGIVGTRYLDQQSRFTKQDLLRGEGEHHGEFGYRAGGMEPTWFKTEQEAMQFSEDVATRNYVLWDQPTLDRTALLERNGEKLDAMRSIEEPTYFAEGAPPPYKGAPLDNALWRLPNDLAISEGSSLRMGSVTDVRDQIGATKNPIRQSLENSLRKVEDASGIGDTDMYYTFDPQHEARFGLFQVRSGKASVTMNWKAIGDDGDLARDTFNHERVHNTLTRLSLDKQAGLPPAQRAALNEISRLMIVSDQFRGQSDQFAQHDFDRYFQNRQEFIAGFKTDLLFRAYLKTVEDGGDNVFGAMGDTIKRNVFGVTADTKLDKEFDRLLGVPELQAEAYRARKEPEPDEVLPTPDVPVFAGTVSRFLDNEAAKRTGDKFRANAYADAANRLRDYPGDFQNLSKTEIATLLGRKNPAKSPGTIAERIYAEIQSARIHGNAAMINNEVASDKSKGVLPEPKVPVEYEGDQNAVAEIARYDQNAASLREQKKDLFKAGLARRWYPNAFEVIGMVQDSMGERTWPLAKTLVKGRQYYLNMRNTYMEKMVDAGVDAGDIRTLPETLWGEMTEYLEGRPANAPSLSDHWKNVGDFFRTTDADTVHRERVQYNRTMRYAKNQKTTGYTDEQKETLEPLRRFYVDEIATGNKNIEEFYDLVAKFVQSPASDALTRENYTPHVNKKRVKDYDPSKDPDNLPVVDKWVKDLQIEEPPPTALRSQRALKARTDTDYNPLDANPLVEMHRNHLRHMSMFYLDQPINDVYSKLISGVMSDGFTPANHLSTPKDYKPLLDKKTSEYFTKWLKNMISMDVQREPWETVMSKARANHFKTMVAKYNLIAKQPFQVLTTGEGAGLRDADKFRGRDYLTRNFEDVITDYSKLSDSVFGEEGKAYTERTRNEVLLGKRLLQKELYGENLQPDRPSAWNLPWFLFSLATDNKAIDFVNKMPLLGGDFAAELNAKFDASNRIGSMRGWLRKGDRLVLQAVKKGDAPPPWSKIKGAFKMSSFLPFQRRQLAELYARGSYNEFVFEAASEHTRQGQFVYDTKLRSLSEVSPIARQVAQYASWWRGYSMNWYRNMQSAVKPDILDPDAIVEVGDMRITRSQLAASKTIVGLITAAAFQQVVFNGATGRLPEQNGDDIDSEYDQWERLFASTFDYYSAYNETEGAMPQGFLDPYDNSLLSVPATPMKIIMNAKSFASFRPWDEQGRGGQLQGPSQVLDSVLRMGRMIYAGSANTIAGLAVATRDPEKGQKIISSGIKEALTQGNYFLENYTWAAWRAGNLLDQYPGTKEGEPARNANQVRQWIETGLEEHLGYIPDWWAEYLPMQQNRDSFYRISTHMVFGGNAPQPRIEDEGFTGAGGGNAQRNTRPARSGRRTRSAIR